MATTNALTPMPVVRSIRSVVVMKEPATTERLPPQRSIPASAAEAVAFLTKTAETKAEDSQAVINTLVGLEKTMRAEAKLEAGLSSATLDALDGAWRLVFTTGTVDTQKKIGGTISYFPLKAIQTFDTRSVPMAITNGIYVGDVAVLKFYGPFEWKAAQRKLTFDFDYIAIFGLKIKLPKGGAAELGAASGLGAKSNIERAKRELPAFFNWISANNDIATARGGGGGLALWRRDLDAQAEMRPATSEA